MLKLYALCVGGLLLASSAFAQDYALRYTRTRPPAFDATRYKQVGIGDIVGPDGGSTQSSLNLTDDLSVNLLKQETVEILDHNALNKLYGSKSSTTTIINETTMAGLAKKTQAALLITGRIQNETVNQSLKTTSSGINNCPTRYWYESFGDFTVQIKVFDVKTAKLAHAEVIKIPMTHKTEEKCEKGGMMDEEDIKRQAAEATAVQISHMLFPYEEALQTELWHPMLGSPFKNAKSAVALFNSGDHKGALDILVGYTTDNAIKEKMKPFSFYNYGLCLAADGQFALAKEQFLKAYALLPGDLGFKTAANKMDREMTLAATTAATRR